MKTTRTIRRQADCFEQDNDGLSLRMLVRECCDEIDHLHRMMAKATDAFLDWGPTDDGTPQGEALEKALLAMRRAVPKRLRKARRQ